VSEARDAASQSFSGAAASPIVVVLLVDDQPIIYEALRRMLEGEPGIELHYCAEAPQALPTARRVRPTVVLQDLVMPDIEGFTLLKFYRREPATATVPVIVLSTREDAHDKSRAFADGASDYLVKLPDKVELVARIRAHSKSYVAQLERDEAFRKLEALTRELEARNAELARLSAVDGLTGVSNRRSFDATLEHEWKRALRERTELSLVLIDVDFFKRYNDAYGHLAGDDCLRKVARALAAVVNRPADSVSRYGGEEFAVLLPSTHAAGAAGVAESMRAAVENLALEHRASDISAHVTLSLGVATRVPLQDSSPNELIESADQALYEAKREGRNRVRAAAVEAK
jgi:two-component system, chemotaxis family, response regulator WspR